MTDEKIVMYDSPEAAEIKTLTGWVSRDGHFWGENEHMARYSGSTHKVCDKCGDVISQRSYCRKCADKREQEKFEAMPREPWDGDSPIYSSHLDKYFFNGDVFDYLEDDEDGLSEEDLMLVHCEPIHLHRIDTDIWEDELRTEDDSAEVPDAVQVALDALNESIKKAAPVAWEAGKKAVQLPLR
jgi:hypothetical protein